METRRANTTVRIWHKRPLMNYILILIQRIKERINIPNYSDDTTKFEIDESNDIEYNDHNINDSLVKIKKSINWLKN